ncbi:helix-turn-helix domain-containing protein [Pedobacter sp. UYP1]|uniref:helix-turn-helix domain-containing protein n=1 Tax=Pedobacter sp. UYP1 TaxID=1756396 RepID=UPI0033928A10
MKYTFEELPQAISALHNKVDNIKYLLLESQKVPPPYADLLTIKQAAEFLSLSVPTLYTKVSRKEIPVNKRGKRLYFSTAELSTWIKSGRKNTQEEIQITANFQPVKENPPPT